MKAFTVTKQKPSWVVYPRMVIKTICDNCKHSLVLNIQNTSDDEPHLECLTTVDVAQYKVLCVLLMRQDCECDRIFSNENKLGPDYVLLTSVWLNTVLEYW